MNRVSLCCLVVACLFASACASSLNGSCSADTDCKSGSKCLSTNSGNFCVVPDGQCFPSCDTGFTCVSGKCQTSVCTPQCGANQICDPSTIQCKDVTVPSVTLTSPAADAFAGLSLQVTATARAPGGVNGVTFQLQDKTTHAVLASAAGAANSAGSANFAAVLTLNGTSIPEGPADLLAVVSYPGGTLNSAVQTVKVDLTGPALALTSDGTTGWLGPANPIGTAAITATDTGGAGVDTATVLLGLDGIAHAGYLAAAGTNNAFTFSVPVSDLGFSATTAIKSGTVTFHIDASDLVGNKAATLTGSKQLFQVDFVAPTGAITTDNNWHAASETAVKVAGTASDLQSGLSGGAAKAVLTGFTSLNQTGTLTSSGFSFAADLSTQTFAATEAKFPITVTVTDNAGNSTAATGNIQVDNQPPVISSILVTTGADATAKGHGYYAAGAGDITVTATIADGGAGVVTNASTPCLQVAGGACVAGKLTSGDAANGSYTFLLPRSAGTGNAGIAPVQFTITAQDSLATGPSDPHHAVTSAAQSIYFDDLAPTIAVTLDPTWYARKLFNGAGVTITVSATISDAGSGVYGGPTPALVPTLKVGANTVPGSTTDGVTWSFPLDLTQAPVGAEGALGFTLSATDAVGAATGAAANTASKAASRNVDDKAPAVTLTSVVKSGTLIAASPSTAPVYYPALVASTGYDATAAAGTGHYLYSDSVDIAGTIQDQGAGISVTSNGPYLQLNGIAISGAPGSSAGPHVAIGNCTEGQSTSCAFTVSGVSLRDLARVGAFNAADNVLQLVLTAADKAVAGDGVTAAVHTTVTAAQNIKVTRFWWSQAVAGSTGISGLAIHPDGDVILTSVAAAGSNSVFALYSNGPFGGPAGTRWAKGAQWYGASGTVTDLGAISGAPVIGAAASAPLIYVATQNRDLVAIKAADGSKAGGCIADPSGTGRLGVFTQTPTVMSNAAIVPGGCEGIVAGASNNSLYGACVTLSGCTNIQTNIGKAASSGTIQSGGSFFVGAGNGIVETSLDNVNNIFNTPSSFTTTDVSVFSGLAADGSQIYGINAVAQKAYAIDTSRNLKWSKTLAASIDGAPVLLAGVGGLLINEDDNVLRSLAKSDGAIATVATLANPGTTVVIASDNHVYSAVGATLAAIDPATGTGLWNYAPAGAGTFTAAPTMNCSGILYAASGATVYALITDAAGLGNTPWPKYQRDSRNSGNADAATQWGVSVGGACTQ